MINTEYETRLKSFYDFFQGTEILQKIEDEAYLPCAICNDLLSKCDSFSESEKSTLIDTFINTSNSDYKAEFLSILND